MAFFPLAFPLGAYSFFKRALRLCTAAVMNATRSMWRTEERGLTSPFRKREMLI
jgi:hypothetical protein